MKGCGKLLDGVAYGALVKQKRGAKRLTQETLALDVFGDSTRKGDISRIENGKTTPQEATIQKINAVLDISEAEMAPIRQGRPIAGQLDNIPSLSREELQNLAARFNIENPFERDDANLRDMLTKRAEDFRALRKEVADLKGISPRLDNMHGAAMAALEDYRVDEAEELLADAREIVTDQLREPLEINAKLMEAQAAAALLRGKVEQAYSLLSAAADSFAPLDPLEPVRRRLGYGELLYSHGLRYGGKGLAFSAEMSRVAIQTSKTGSTLWANAQNNLGIALQDQGIRTEGAAGTDLLAEAVTAYTAALTVRTKDAHPVDWAMTQNNLGNALANQGIRTEGAAGTALLAKAVTAYNAALTFRTKDAHPMKWAMTQNNLGNALRNQGIRTEGAAGTDFLAEAVTAYTAALTVRTKDAHPVDWAMTQNNLGGALGDQGSLTEGAAGTALLAEAVTAYTAALTVRTKDAHPVDWAVTQNNLGGALQSQGTRTEGAGGTALLAEAVTAFTAALTVRTKDADPVGWAMTRQNLAIAELKIAKHDATVDPRPHLEAALAHVDAAFTIYDPEHMSYDHGTATRLRDRIQAALDALP